MHRHSRLPQDVWIVSTDAPTGTVTTDLHVTGEAAVRMVAAFRSDAFGLPGDVHTASATIPIPGPSGVAAAYQHDPEMVRSLVENDVGAEDVLSLARRKQNVEEFHKLLENPDYFEQQVQERNGHSPEGVWQDFFESNQWILGLGLSEQLLVAVNPEKLEQVVAGHSMTDDGKRTDALLRTAGSVRLIALAEIKTHRTGLLGSSVRSGVWPPSVDLSQAVAQSQTTVQLTEQAYDAKIRPKDEEGYELSRGASHLYRPRAFVVAGRLDEFTNGDGDEHIAKIRSFELYRRNLQYPEVLTYDEVLARAEASIARLEERIDA